MSSPPSPDARLREAVAGAGPERTVTLDPRFQGLPRTAHGGTVLALFDAVAGTAAARAIAGSFRRRVPLDTALGLTVSPRGEATHLTLSEGPTVLVEGDVGPLAAPAPSPGAPAAALALTERDALPISRTCFACGTDNPLGLQARLALDDEHVGGVWTPREAFRTGEGLAPVALTTLLDEAAFWLGAAATGESGMTTELRLAVHRPPPFGRLVIAGSRRAVRPRADDARYWDTQVAAWDEAGALVASAAITFVAVRGGARKLVSGLLAVNPGNVLRRVFPAYVP